MARGSSKWPLWSTGSVGGFWGGVCRGTAAPRHDGLSVSAESSCGDDVGQDVPGLADGGGIMTDTPQLLLAHHLKALKLPTFLREYDKLARQGAAEGLDHICFLLRLAELELIDRERRMVERR